MIKAKNVDTTNVTPEQIGKCHKIFEGSNPVWMVESEQDALTEYKVKWTREHGFTCTCKAGQEGFAHCGPASQGLCKHVVWSVAASAEEREALAELQAASCTPTAPVRYVTNVDAATLARIEAANERAATKPTSRAKAPTPRGFSLLR